VDATSEQSASVDEKPDAEISDLSPTETSSITETAPPASDTVRELTGADQLDERDSEASSPPPAVTGGAPANGTNGLLKMSHHEMDVTELRVRVACHEKNNMALKMELKCAELQVACREQFSVEPCTDLRQLNSFSQEWTANSCRKTE
jgi:hypothetical protein